MTGPARDYWEARGGYDEEFIDHSLPHLACSHCGSEDCPGYGPEEEYPPCVPVCLCCGRLPDDCPGNVAEFFAEQDRKP